MKNNRNRISTKDTIKATSFDINGKIISSIYDSGFSSIREVRYTLTTKGSGQLRKIKYIPPFLSGICRGLYNPRSAF